MKNCNETIFKYCNCFLKTFIHKSYKIFKNWSFWQDMNEENKHSHIIALKESTSLIFYNKNAANFVCYLFWLGTSSSFFQTTCNEKLKV